MLAVIGTVGGGADGWAAPITFNTALPVAKGEFVFREQFVVAQSGEDASGSDRDRRALAAVSVLGYGVSGKLAVFGVLPFVDKALDVTVAGVRQRRSASGLGMSHCSVVIPCTRMTSRGALFALPSLRESKRPPAKTTRATHSVGYRPASSPAPAPGVSLAVRW